MQALMNSVHISATNPLKTSNKCLIPRKFSDKSIILNVSSENGFKPYSKSLKAVAMDSKAVDSRPLIVIDNYDSFTYNICQYVGELGTHFEVYRNDEISVEELKRKNPRGILISPGPGAPQDSGISLATVLELGSSVPIFGVCMGLQCIGQAFGGKVVRSPYGVMHGKSSPVYYDEKGSQGLFSGLPNPFTAARYHSLVVERDDFPEELEITAWTEDGLVMAARHKEYKYLQGVQFHPESVLTPEGMGIIKNFIKMIESDNESESSS
ncbi:unnamed protein product [Amaranthus hypochondriacus]